MIAEWDCHAQKQHVSEYQLPEYQLTMEKGILTCIPGLWISQRHLVACSGKQDAGPTGPLTMSKSLCM